ncbi:interferon-inducible GTPase 1-like [Xenia sp. Carnegie-2017]|uniref:interferon-inducible GTPase 1-like n=1 Tax=Xenia sp. Carnegie-2017 TaxID=2897299 RepID=UPI001F04D9AC|nr:interferon-inducible GTPase 1-like [Xenia sp. Carnegie-2017]
MPFIFILTHSDESKDNKASLLEQLKRDVEGLMKDEADIYEINNRDTANHKSLCEDIISKLEKRRKDLFLHSLNKTICKNNEITKESFKQAKKQGVPHIQDLYSSHLIASWMNTEINLAIIGDSGTGKSSFINAVRGIKAYEKEAAAVDVTETTKKATRYLHPKHKNIIFWDLPGIGTPKYPNYKEYCKKVGGLEKYDAFLIFCKTRFTHYDKVLAEKASKDLDKPFFFVRTNVDTELKNAEDDEGPKFNEASVMKRMRENCLKNLEGLIHDEKDIFLIDNRITEKYDFQHLKESIAEALPEEKQESFVASLDKSTHAIIRIKANFLRAQVSKVIVLGMIAEPYLETFVQLISKEVTRYYRVFGFHDQSKSEEEIGDEIKEFLKQKAVDKSPAKVQSADEYLTKRIGVLQKNALDRINRNNSQPRETQ